MPYPELKGLLTDIGTEELGHLEIIGAIVHQLTRNLTEDQIKSRGASTPTSSITPPGSIPPPPPAPPGTPPAWP